MAKGLDKIIAEIKSKQVAAKHVYNLAFSVTAGGVVTSLQKIIQFSPNKSTLIKSVLVEAYHVAATTRTPIENVDFDLSENSGGLVPFVDIGTVSSGYDVSNRLDNSLHLVFNKNLTPKIEMPMTLRSGLTYSLTLNAFEGFDLGESFIGSCYIEFEQ